MASNILLYSDKVLYNVREILWTIKERGGLASSKFLLEQEAKYRGEYSIDCINVALMAMGRPMPFPEGGKASEAQLAVLIEKAQKYEGLLLHEIAELRAAKGKA